MEEKKGGGGERRWGRLTELFLLLSLETGCGKDEAHTILGGISSWRQSKHLKSFCNCQFSCKILKCVDRERNFAEIQLSLSSNANG